MTTNKPEVKRYTPAYSVDSVMRGHLFMEECERGAWVSLEDHKAQQAECEKLRKDAERYKEALARISIQVDGNIRDCVRDCVNGRPDVQDIYGYCDEIDSIIDAAMEIHQ